VGQRIEQVGSKLGGLHGKRVRNRSAITRARIKVTEGEWNVKTDTAKDVRYRDSPQGKGEGEGETSQEDVLKRSLGLKEWRKGES